MLADGQWHNLKKIKLELINRVPPGRALRAYETKANFRANKYGPRQKPELSDQEKIDSGRTTLVNAALHSMSKRHVELRGDPIIDNREVRLRPGIIPPGAAPALPVEQEPALDYGLDDGPGHHGTGEPREPPSRPSPLAEEYLRAVVIDAVQPLIDEALDEFASGLREYLDHNFVNLDVLIRRALGLKVKGERTREHTREHGREVHERRN